MRMTYVRLVGKKGALCKGDDDVDGDGEDEDEDDDSDVSECRDMERKKRGNRSNFSSPTPQLIEWH